MHTGVKIYSLLCIDGILHFIISGHVCMEIFGTESGCLSIIYVISAQVWVS